jgi:hypothetical protein
MRRARPEKDPLWMLGAILIYLGIVALIIVLANVV